MKWKWMAAAALAVAAITVLPAAAANGIRNVFVVNDLMLEVEMKQPLTEEEIRPSYMQSPSYKSVWEVGPDIEVTGFPIPQPSDGFHDNVYRIPVNGLEPDIIYHISYKGQKPKTFKYYEGKEGEDRYKNRYGSYF